MNPAKRVRSSNFNKEEKLLLLEEILKYKSVIECKTTNKLSLGDKENAWQKIAASFNAKNLHARTVEQIKTKYDNLKAKARKEVAMLKLSRTGTGGGPGVGDLDCVVEAVLKIINFKTVVGLQNKYDNDWERNCVVKDVVEDNQIIFSIVDEVQLDRSVHAQDVQVDLVEPVSQSIENLPVVEDHLPVDRKMIEVPSTSDTVAEVLIDSEPAVSWSKYTPTKLKSKIHNRLRSKVHNPTASAKEVYYKRKLEIIEKSFQQECLDRESKNARDAEEHSKKMLLLDLEIQLKQKQLLKESS
ncbi:Myb/SANT-like DNA-binding domain [Popillia japonica]|uniref:Regulatory protein zeste n=1 Tax=Popillia japonica TaxID=7064 RepID=A0AAW1HU57_POPJA